MTIAPWWSRGHDFALILLMGARVLVWHFNPDQGAGGESAAVHLAFSLSSDFFEEVCHSNFVRFLPPLVVVWTVPLRDDARFLLVRATMTKPVRLWKGWGTSMVTTTMTSL
jgi:hypothetical protein